MVVQCCVCKKVRETSGWTAKSVRVLTEEVSHGYCPECANAAFAAIRAHYAEKREAQRRAGNEVVLI